MIDWRKARGGMRSREGGSRTTRFRDSHIISIYPSYSTHKRRLVDLFSPILYIAFFAYPYPFPLIICPYRPHFEPSRVNFVWGMTMHGATDAHAHAPLHSLPSQPSRGSPIHHPGVGRLRVTPALPAFAQETSYIPCYSFIFLFLILLSSIPVITYFILTYPYLINIYTHTCLSIR
jgi:hypothetical protein